MKIQQYYLMKLSEEALEVAHIALKAMQFGADEVMQGQPFTNFERIHAELNDMNAMIEELNEKFDFNYQVDPLKVAKKKEKVLQYLKLSQEYGEVQTSNQEEILEKNSMKIWSVFNNGACVADEVDYKEACSYMTPERIERGWTLVAVIDKNNFPI